MCGKPGASRLLLLSGGVILTVLAEILWRVLPPGRLLVSGGPRNQGSLVVGVLVFQGTGATLFMETTTYGPARVFVAEVSSRGF